MKKPDKKIRANQAQPEKNKSLLTKTMLMKILLSLLTLSCILCGMLIPKLLLERKYDPKRAEAQIVPESYYSASKTAMAKKSSELLSPLAKLKLITGAWESSCAPASTADATITESAAVELSRQKLVYLYDNGYYPCSVRSDFGNWYSWTTQLYSFTDTTFHTYTSYLWIITFTRFDNTLSHTVYMTEDGILLAAYVNEKPQARKAFQSDVESVRTLFCDDKLRLEDSQEAGLTIDVFRTRFNSVLAGKEPALSANAADKLQCSRVILSQQTDETEEYLIYQFETSEGYCLGILPE